MATHLACGYSGFYFACRAYDLATGVKPLGLGTVGPSKALGLGLGIWSARQWDEGRQVDIAIAAAVLRPRFLDCLS